MANLEDLIAQDKVRYFNITDIPAGVDVEATKQKYGFVAAYDFMNREGTVYYNKQSAIDAGLTPQPNGTIPSGISWEMIPTPPAEVVKDDIILLRDMDVPDSITLNATQQARLLKAFQGVLKTLPETKDLT